MGPGSVLSGAGFIQGQLWNWVTAYHSPVGAVLIWLFGLIFGFLLASLFGISSKGAAFLRWSPPGTFIRRAALMFHGIVIVRDLWYTWFPRGTFHRLLRDVGAYLWPSFAGVQSLDKATASIGATESHPSDSTWPVTTDDLAFCKSLLELENSRYKKIVDKNVGDSATYHCMYRVLPGNKTEYKSITIVENATAEEMTDFYLDDDWRAKWDGLIADHRILENGSVKNRCQIVNWIRTFPFPFLSDREYIIARRTFVEGDTIFTVTKSCEHPDAPLKDDIVRMDEFYSMWSCRTIKSPWGTDAPACEIVLLHHEQFKIPERLARFAACKGMWGFVKGMVPYSREFVDERRRSCEPTECNPCPYGFVDESKDAASSADSTEVKKDDVKKVKRTLGRTVVATAVTAAVFLLRPR